jgi:hypothetical protein
VKGRLGHRRHALSKVGGKPSAALISNIRVIFLFAKGAVFFGVPKKISPLSDPPAKKNM